MFGDQTEIKLVVPLRLVYASGADAAVALALFDRLADMAVPDANGVRWFKMAPSRLADLVGVSHQRFARTVSGLVESGAVVIENRLEDGRRSRWYGVRHAL